MLTVNVCTDNNTFPRLKYVVEQDQPDCKSRVRVLYERCMPEQTATEKAGVAGCQVSTSCMITI